MAFPRIRIGMRVIFPAALLSSAATCLALDANVPAGGMPSATTYSSTVLPSRTDVVPWETLAKVEAVQKNGRMVPVYNNEILALDKRAARVQGFMIPLDAGDKQKHFLLAAVPSNCPFCLPALFTQHIPYVSPTPACPPGSDLRFQRTAWPSTL